MINDFYAALLNTSGGHSRPGSDYLPQQWRVRHTTPAADAIRRSLLIRPESREAANWRSAEIRRILRGCDLQSFMWAFDNRVGYEVGDLQREMSLYLHPTVSADDGADTVKFEGKLSSDAYVLNRWHIQIASGVYRINANQRITTDVLQPGTTTVTLPETQVLCIFPSVDNNIMISWASRPTTTITETATQLRTNLAATINDLAAEPNVYDNHDRQRLRDIILHNGESPVQVVAASLLLAGATLAGTPVEQTDVNTANAGNS